MGKPARSLKVSQPPSRISISQRGTENDSTVSNRVESGCCCVQFLLLSDMHSGKMLLRRFVLLHREPNLTFMTE